MDKELISTLNIDMVCELMRQAEDKKSYLWQKIKAGINMIELGKLKCKNLYTYSSNYYVILNLIDYSVDIVFCTKCEYYNPPYPHIILFDTYGYRLDSDYNVSTSLIMEGIFTKLRKLKSAYYEMDEDIT